MTGYYEIQDFAVEIDKKIIDKRMIIFYNLEGKELTREIFINKDFIIYENNLGFIFFSFFPFLFILSQ